MTITLPYIKLINPSDRLKLAIGHAGGFSRHIGMELSQPDGNWSVNRRMNVIGDRYWALIERSGLKDVFTQRDIDWVCDAFREPWRHSADQIHNFPTQLANILDVTKYAIRNGSQEWRLVQRVSELDMSQLFALVERIDEYFPDIDEENTCEQEEYDKSCSNHGHNPE